MLVRFYFWSNGNNLCTTYHVCNKQYTLKLTKHMQLVPCIWAMNTNEHQRTRAPVYLSCNTSHTHNPDTIEHWQDNTSRSSNAFLINKKSTNCLMASGCFFLGKSTLSTMAIHTSLLSLLPAAISTSSVNTTPHVAVAVWTTRGRSQAITRQHVPGPTRIEILQTCQWEQKFWYYWWFIIF